MMRTPFSAILLILSVSSGLAAEPEWKELIGDKPLEAWRSPSDQWIHAGDARLDEKNPRKLEAVTGKGVLVNGPGRLKDLMTKDVYTDVDLHVEFMIPRGSN